MVLLLAIAIYMYFFTFWLYFLTTLIRYIHQMPFMFWRVWNFSVIDMVILFLKVWQLGGHGVYMRAYGIQMARPSNLE